MRPIIIYFVTVSLQFYFWTVLHLVSIIIISSSTSSKCLPFFLLMYHFILIGNFKLKSHLVWHRYWQIYHYYYYYCYNFGVCFCLLSCCPAFFYLQLLMMTCFKVFGCFSFGVCKQHMAWVSFIILSNTLFLMWKLTPFTLNMIICVISFFPSLCLLFYFLLFVSFCPFSFFKKNWPSYYLLSFPTSSFNSSVL